MVKSIFEYIEPGLNIRDFIFAEVYEIEACKTCAYKLKVTSMFIHKLLSSRLSLILHVVIHVSFILLYRFN